MIKFNVRPFESAVARAKISKAAKKSEVWLANEVLKDTRPFVPARTMSQANKSHQILVAEDKHESMQDRVKSVGNLVIYPGPYARYLYFGKVMKGPRTGPKYATDKDLVISQAVNPQAQAFWFEASEAQNKDKWIRGVKKIAKSDI